MSDPSIEILHVGSASRDLTDGDPRGWRLGGGVTYAALTTARLGLRTAALVGADATAAAAAELDLLRQAGVALRVVPLAESPVFRNVEAAGGRIQTCLAPGHPLPAVDLPAEWRAATAWSFVPIAREVGDAWAPAVPGQALLALGWQGWLRDLVAGRAVRRRAPEPLALLRRADLVGVSRHDLAPRTRLGDLRLLIRPEAGLLVTDGVRGGRFVRRDADGVVRGLSYEAIPPDAEIDPTGAGDTLLGALLAAFVRPSIVGDGGLAVELDLAFAAAAASLVIERPGLLGVPDRAAVLERGRRGQSGRLAPTSTDD